MKTSSDHSVISTHEKAMSPWTINNLPSKQDELEALQAKEAAVQKEIDNEAKLVKLWPRNTDYCRRWADLCELRSEILKAIGLLTLSSGRPPEPLRMPPEDGLSPQGHQSGGGEASGA